MSSQLYNVVFRGELAEGQTQDEVKRNLAARFKLTPQQLESAFSGKPLMVKTHVEYQTALKYKAAFERAGTRCQLEPISQAAGETRPSTPNIASPAQSQQYRVVFDGTLAAGKTLAEVQRNIAALCRKEEHQIAWMFTGKPVTVQKNLSRQTARKVQRAFEQAGAICTIRNSQTNKPKRADAASTNAPTFRPPRAKAPASSPTSNTNAPREAQTPTDLAAIVASYRGRSSGTSRFLLAPHIPTYELDLAMKSYAYAYNSRHEDALMLAEQTAFGGGLLLTTKRLYLHERHGKPRNFLLPRIETIELDGTKLMINAEQVFSAPVHLKDDLALIVEILRNVVAAVPKPAAGETRRKELESDRADESAAGFWNGRRALAAAIVLVVAGIAWIFLWNKAPASPDDSQIQNMVIETLNSPHIEVDLVSVKQIGEVERQQDQNVLPVKVFISGECRDEMMLENVMLRLTHTAETDWTLATPNPFGLEYLVCPLTIAELTPIIDAAIPEQITVIDVQDYNVAEDFLPVVVQRPARVEKTAEKGAEFEYDKLDGHVYKRRQAEYKRSTETREVHLSKDAQGEWAVAVLEGQIQEERFVEDSREQVSIELPHGGRAIQFE